MLQVLPPALNLLSPVALQDLLEPSSHLAALNLEHPVANNNSPVIPVHSNQEDLKALKDLLEPSKYLVALNLDHLMEIKEHSNHPVGLSLEHLVEFNNPSLVSLLHNNLEHLPALKDLLELSSHLVAFILDHLNSLP